MAKKTKEKPVVMGVCSVAGCSGNGEYKAPKSRLNIEEYQYFCLDHVRDFNKAWDFFDGWSRKEIEDFMDSAASGHKPTWSMSARVGGPQQDIFISDDLRQSLFEMLGKKTRTRAAKKVRTVSRKEREAFAVLDLETDASVNEIKSQYKKLVKKHHPDVNKGDKKSEEMVKRITSAYTMLIKLYGKQNEK